jgi:hypothetical protein
VEEGHEEAGHQNVSYNFFFVKMCLRVKNRVTNLSKFNTNFQNIFYITYNIFKL